MSSNKLSLDAVAGSVKRRSERSKAALAWRHRYNPATDPAFVRQPDIVKPVARCLVQSGCGHESQGIVTDGRIDDPPFGDWIHSAISQRRPHHCQIPGAHVQRTLPRVKVGCLSRITINSLEALQQ